MEARIKVTEIRPLTILGEQWCLLWHHVGQGSQWILLDQEDPEEENNIFLNKYHLQSRFSAIDKTSFFFFFYLQEPCRKIPKLVSISKCWAGSFVSFYVWDNLEDDPMCAFLSNLTPGAHLVVWTPAGSPDLAPARMRSNLKSNSCMSYSRPNLFRRKDLLFLGDPAKQSPGRGWCFIWAAGILTEWRGNMLLTGGPSAPARPATPCFPCGPCTEEAKNARFNDQTYRTHLSFRYS